MTFNDEPASQAYLSLGLTPLSQLSPPDSQDVGFFPSIPPPISTVVDDHEKYSIPVDEPIFLEESRRFPKRNRKTELETVPEQPSSMSPSSRYSQGMSPFQRTTQQDESFVFPSANISQDYMRPLNTTSNANRLSSPSNGARNYGFSAQYDNDLLIDFNEYGSGYSIHVDSSPDAKLNGRELNYHSSSNPRDSSPHQRQFTRRDPGRQGVKRSRGDLSQRLSQEMQPRQPRREKVYDVDDDDDDLSTGLLQRPTSPPGVYPPQFSDASHNFTPPVKDFVGSMTSISDFKEDHASTLL